MSTKWCKHRFKHTVLLMTDEVCRFVIAVIRNVKLLFRYEVLELVGKLTPFIALYDTSQHSNILTHVLMNWCLEEVVPAHQEQQSDHSHSDGRATREQSFGAVFLAQGHFDV